MSSECPPSELIAAALRLAIAAVLLLSGTFKLWSDSDVTPLMQLLGIRGARTGLLLFRASTIGEVGLCIWICSGIRTSEALATAALLFIAFTAAIVVLLRRG